MRHKHLSPIDYILENSIPEPNSGCWIWLGSWMGDPNNPYGCANHRNIHMRAHRFSYRAFKGETNGLNVLHKCDVRMCVNPEHLFLGTHSDNMQDMVRKGRKPAKSWPGVYHDKLRFTGNSTRIHIVRSLSENTDLSSTEIGIILGIKTSHARRIISGRIGKNTKPLDYETYYAKKLYGKSNLELRKLADSGEIE